MNTSGTNGFQNQKALHDAAKIMVRVRNPRRLLRMIVSLIDREIGLTHASFLIYERKKSRYIFVDSRGTHRIPIQLIRLDDTNPLIRWFSQKGPKSFRRDCLTYESLCDWLTRPLAGQNVEPSETLRAQWLDLKDVMRTLRASVCVPGHYKDELLGVVILGEKLNGAPFTPAEISFFQTLASDASMALKTAAFQDDVIKMNRELTEQQKLSEEHIKEIAALRKKEQETYYEIVMSLAQEVYAKDPYTSRHLQGVERLGLMTAEEMGYDLSGRRKDILVASLHLHDVGKIGIPDRILMKPAALTDEEWKVMRLHPEKGAKILSPLSGFQDVAEIVLHHHERFDGTGYPHRKRGEHIPFEARIIAVVDAFHAIVSERCYKKGHPVEKAYRELKRCAGSQFDPGVVEAFIRVHKRLMDERADNRAEVPLPKVRGSEV